MQEQLSTNVTTAARIRWGILGTGEKIAQTIAKAIQASETGELVGIASRESAKAQAFAEKFGLAKFYDNCQALIDDPDIDAVYIGLPTHLHAKWAINCIKAGKHVLCEKPFTGNVAAVKAIMSEINAAKTQVFCMEALMYWYHPIKQAIIDLTVHKKTLGNLLSINASYTADIEGVANKKSGAIDCIGGYPASLVRAVANAEPTKIIGKGTYNEDGNDNTASVNLKFASGLNATIFVAYNRHMSWQFEVRGTKGKMQLVTNPWLPDEDNIINLYLNNEPGFHEIRILAEKPLYTFQIDEMGKHIQQETHCDAKKMNDILLESLKNVMLLESWRACIRQQAKQAHEIETTPLIFSETPETAKFPQVETKISDISTKLKL